MLLSGFFKFAFGCVMLLCMLSGSVLADANVQGSRHADITVVCPTADAHVPVSGSHHLASVTCRVTYPKADRSPPRVSLSSQSHDIQLAYGPVSVTSPLTQTRDLLITYATGQSSHSSSAELIFYGDRGARVALKINFFMHKDIA